MRRLSASAALFALALTACNTDATRDRLAPSAPVFARGDHADADTRTMHIQGTVEAIETGTPQPGSPIVQRHLEGGGTASHLGRFTTVGNITLNLVTASGTGTVTYTAANGDMLSGTAVGQAVVAAGTATVTETVTITGGTGRFAGATGTFTVVRRIVQATGISTGTIEGMVTIPK
jgi:hypothetical protein